MTRSLLLLGFCLTRGHAVKTQCNVETNQETVGDLLYAECGNLGGFDCCTRCFDQNANCVAVDLNSGCCNYYSTKIGTRQADGTQHLHSQDSPPEPLPPAPTPEPSATSRRALLAVDMTDWYYGEAESKSNGIHYQRDESVRVARTLMANQTMTFDMILDVHEHMVCEPMAESTECLVSGSARHSLNSSLLPELQYDHVRFVPKKQYSGFYGSALDSALRTAGIQDLYIMGYDFQWCVFFTVLDAWYRGYNVYVVVNGSGSFGEEAFQEGLNMYKGFFKAGAPDDFFEGARGWVRLWNFNESLASGAYTTNVV